MKRFLTVLISTAILGSMIFTSCNQNTIIPAANNGSQEYHPELYFTLNDYVSEGTSYFDSRNGDDDKDNADSKSMGDMFTSALGDFFKKKCATIQGKVVTLLGKAGEMAFDYVANMIIDRLNLKKNGLIGALFGKVTDGKDTFKQIMALAESQVIINSKLDRVFNAVNLGVVSNNLNDKISQFNAIQVIDTATATLISQLYSSYEDVLTNGTDEEIAEANQIIDAQIKKIITDWGNTSVHGTAQYLNASIIMKNYQTKYLCGAEPDMTYLDMYDYIASKVYGWESEGYEMREIYRTVDKAVITQTVALASVYYRIMERWEDVERLNKEYKEFLAFCETKAIDFRYDQIICQIGSLNGKKFERDLSFVDAAKVYTAFHSYGSGADTPDENRINFKKWDVPNRIRFGCSLSNWDSFSQPALLSMNQYREIVDYYDNKYTLREIFTNFAKFDNAEEIFENLGDKEDRKGVHSFLYNDANTSDWWGSDDNSYHCLYYSVTDMNSKNLPSQSSDWKSQYHAERDYKFFTGCDFRSSWSKVYLYDRGRIFGSNYRIFWPVIIN